MWLVAPTPPGFRNDAAIADSVSWWRNGPIRVCSALELADAPDGRGDSIAQWHLSMSKHHEPPMSKVMRDVLRDFGFDGAEEDNHEPGRARHFWMPVDPSRRHSELFRDDANTLGRELANYAEMLAAAFAEETDIPASECEIFTDLTPTGMRICMRRRETPPTKGPMTTHDRIKRAVSALDEAFSEDARALIEKFNANLAMVMLQRDEVIKERDAARAEFAKEWERANKAEGALSSQVAVTATWRERAKKMDVDLSALRDACGGHGPEVVKAALVVAGEYCRYAAYYMPPTEWALGLYRGAIAAEKPEPVVAPSLEPNAGKVAGPWIANGHTRMERRDANGQWVCLACPHERGGFISRFREPNGDNWHNSYQHVTMDGARHAADDRARTRLWTLQDSHPAQQKAPPFKVGDRVRVKTDPKRRGTVAKAYRMGDRWEIEVRFSEALTSIGPCDLYELASSEVDSMTDEELASGHSLLDAIRSRGWAVAVHNDYRMKGKPHTFYLFTKGASCLKGEGRTDAEALAIVATAAGIKFATGGRNV